MINYGLAPYFKGILIDEVKKSDIVVLLKEEKWRELNQVLGVSQAWETWNILLKLGMKLALLRLRFSEGLAI